MKSIRPKSLERTPVEPVRNNVAYRYQITSDNKVVPSYGTAPRNRASRDPSPANASPPAANGRHSMQIFRQSRQIFRSPYDQVKAYQRQFETEAYDIASVGLLDKILELNALLAGRKMSLTGAPMISNLPLKDCPSEINELISIVEEAYIDATETYRKLRTWLCLLTPRLGDSSSTEARVHNSLMDCVSTGIDMCWAVLKKNIEMYHLNRAEKAALFIKNPDLDDYKTALCYMDRMHFIELRDNLVLLRDRYMITHDLLDKNLLENVDFRRMTSQ